MKKNRHIDIVILSVFAALCALGGIIMGLFVTDEQLSSISINSGIIIIALFVAGFLVLIYPIAKMIKRKKFYRLFLLWLLVAVLLWLTPFVLITLYAAVPLLILCILAECNAALKTDENKSYLFIQIILYVLAFASVFACCFAGLYDVTEELMNGSFGVALNKLVELIVLSVSAVIIITIILLGIKAVRVIKVDMFNPELIGVFNKIIKRCKVSVVYSLLSPIGLMLIELFVASLTNTSYSISFLFDELWAILVVCFVIVLVSMLKRSIAEHEENKMTI